MTEVLPVRTWGGQRSNPDRDARSAEYPGLSAQEEKTTRCTWSFFLLLSVWEWLTSDSFFCFPPVWEWLTQIAVGRFQRF